MSTHQKELIDLVTRLHNIFSSDSVPLSIFSTQLSPGEALVKHLKEDKNMRYFEIAQLLNRDQRGIWCTYQRAQKKHTRSLPKTSAHHIPLALFKNRERSILEHITAHLREQHLPIKTIAYLLNKHPSTISTAYNRARKKQ